MRLSRNTLLTLLALVLVGCGGGDAFEADPSSGMPEAMAPEAVATGPAMVSEHTMFSLDGSGSTFEEGAVLAWEQVAGPPATIANPAAVAPSIAAPGVDEDTELRFQLRIANPSGMTDQTEVVLQVLRREIATWMADTAAEGVFDVFVSDLASGESVNLTSSVGGTVLGYALSPKRGHVAFLAEDSGSGQLELYTVRIDGTDLTVRSGASVPAGDVSWFAWSPDGTSLAYVADKRVDAMFELFVVAADSRAPQRVSGPLVEGGDVLDAAWAPDGSRLLYRADAREVATFELYTVAPDGSELRRVSGDVAGAGGIEDAVVGSDYAWAPDALHIAYIASAESFADQLFVSTPDGTTQHRVSGDLVMEGAVLDFAWAPAASTLAYRAREDQAQTTELYVVDPDGSGHRRVSMDLDPGEAVTRFAWAPDSAGLAIVADPSGALARELFLVDPEGVLVPQTLSDGETQDEPVAADIFWRPDGGGVLYLDDPDVPGETQLIGSTTDGSNVAVRLSPSPQPGAGARAPAWSPTDGNAAAYMAEEGGVGRVALYLGFLDGSAGRRQSADLPDGASVRSFLWHPAGTHLAYVADGESVNLLDVYLVPSTAVGAGDALRLSSEGSALTEIKGLRLVP